MTPDDRLFAPAVQRNRDAILGGLHAVLPQAGCMLEIASGTGEHVAHFARAFPHLTFQPTDRDAAMLPSIDAWAADTKTGNLRPALLLDAAREDWPLAAADAVLCINMTHISPPAATDGLLRGAARLLPPGAPLVLYGPFHQAGVPLAPSNAAFDEDLRARDPAWGIRHLDDLAARATGFLPPAVLQLPANNLLVTFRRRAPYD